MALVEVTEVVPPEPSEPMLDAAIEAPADGTEEDVYALRIGGWVLGRSSPPAMVEVRSRRNLIQTAKVDVPRPDVFERADGATGDERCGFEFVVGTLGVGEQFQLKLIAQMEDGSRFTLGWVRGRREPLRSDFEPSIQPLMVTSPGRSGTTLLMAMVGAHPDIVVHGGYPFEAWPAKYWALALRMLSDPADWERSTRPLWLDGDLFRLGRNPFALPHEYRRPGMRDWIGRGQVERTAALAQESVERWYEVSAQEQGKNRPAYFAEKQMVLKSLAREVLWELYPRAREVFMVRDFRDMALSRVRFRRQQKLRRGKEPDDPSREKEYVRTEFTGMVSGLAEAWRQNSGRAHLVRYENLLLEPRDTLTALLGHLGLDYSHPVLEAMMAPPAIPDRHVTASDPAASVGRWRQDGDKSFLEACESLNDLLAEFGYSPT